MIPIFRPGYDIQLEECVSGKGKKAGYKWRITTTTGRSVADGFEADKRVASGAVVAAIEAHQARRAAKTGERNRWAMSLRYHAKARPYLVLGMMEWATLRSSKKSDDSKTTMRDAARHAAVRSEQAWRELSEPGAKPPEHNQRGKAVEDVAEVLIDCFVGTGLVDFNGKDNAKQAAQWVRRLFGQQTAEVFKSRTQKVEECQTEVVEEG